MKLAAYLATVAGLALVAVLLFPLPHRNESEELAHRSDLLLGKGSVPGIQSSPITSGPAAKDRSNPVGLGATGEDPLPSGASSSARQQLELSLEETVLGVVDPEAILQQTLAILGDEVDKPDLEYWDDQATAFPITMPQGMSAYLLVGREKFERGGVELREYSVRLEIAPDKSPWVSNGAVRHGYSVEIGASRDSEGNAWRFSIFTKSKVALHESRELGIDAYHGRFAEGVYWIFYPDGMLPTYCRTTGIVDGQYGRGEFDERLPDIVGQPGKDLFEAWNSKVSQLVKGTQ